MNSGKDKSPDEEFEIPEQSAPEASNDDQAESEAAALAFGLDLNSKDTERKINRITRQDKVDGLAFYILRAFMITAAVIVISSFLVLFWHFLAPEKYLYLSEERVSRLKELLLSGSIGAALASIGKSSILDRPKQE